MQGFLQDARIGVRQWAARPGFAAAAVLTLGLGIGANTAIFTIVNAVFLRPMPVGDIDRIVSVNTVDSRNNINGTANFLGVSYLNVDDLRDATTAVFDGIAVQSGAALTLDDESGSQGLAGQMVTANYFDVLGVKPYLGRTFQPGEDDLGASHYVVVLSYSLWQRQFGGDPSIVGRDITMNQIKFTVIGVAPQGFKGTFTLGTPDRVWVTTSVYRDVTAGLLREIFRLRRAVVGNPVARLKPGVALATAESAVRGVGDRLAAEYPRDNGNRTFTLVPLADSAIGINQRGSYVQAGALLMSVVGVVLLVACVNLVSLLLARAATRRAEMSVRVAMGAERLRIMRQLLTESLMLAIAGGLAGVLIAYWGTAWLWSLRPPFLAANAIELTLDWRVLAFTGAVAIGAALLFGLVPAWRASRVDLAQVLRAAGRSGQGDASTHRLLKSLVIVEVALAVVAVAGAALFLRSLDRARQIDLGFESERLLAVNFSLPEREYSTERGQQFYKDLVERVAGMPGVASAAASTSFPLGGATVRSIFTEEGLKDAEARGIFVTTANVSPQFFDTIGVSLKRGRLFTEADRADTLPVAVVTESFAERFWPGEDPLGKRAAFFNETTLREVVGVIPDFTIAQIGEPPTNVIFLPLAQYYSPNITLHVRTSSDPSALLTPVIQTIQGMDRSIVLGPGSGLTMAQILEQTLWPARTGAQLLGLFSGLTLLLVIVGIHGVFGYTVAQRTSEIGLRMALGADQATVKREVVRDCLTLTGIGLVVGGVSAVFLARLVGGLLYGVGPADPVAIGAAVVVLTVVAIAASYLPSRRAAKVEPLEALRG